MKSLGVVLTFSLLLLSSFALASDAAKVSPKVTAKDVTVDMASKIKVGSSNRARVTELLGAPWRSVNYGDCEKSGYQEVWEYLGHEAGAVFRISIQFDEAGIARVVTKTSSKGSVVVLAAAPNPNATHEH